MTYWSLSQESQIMVRVSPLVSRLLINPISESLSGTKVICEAEQTSSLQSTTTITVVWDSLQDLHEYG